jgi:hypothetical protein
VVPTLFFFSFYSIVLNVKQTNRAEQRVYLCFLRCIPKKKKKEAPNVSHNVQVRIRHPVLRSGSRDKGDEMNADSAMKLQKSKLLLAY